MPGTRTQPPGWADLLVVPLVVIISLPPLIWFGHHWTISSNDTARYLLAGSQLITGQALEGLDSISEFNGNHGPVLPAMVGSLILVFGRETAELVWALRLVALVNPLLAYLLVKRISTPVAGLIAAALVSLLGVNVKAAVGINIDALQLTFYLLSLLALLGAMKRGGSSLALLSGVLLGVCILTKENALVDLPLALLAVLLLDWEMRWALWHYLGVLLACLPWWAWAYSATGEVYLVGRLPAGLRTPILIAALVLIVLAVAAYVSGMVDRFLAGQSRRRWVGWSLVLAWTVALTGLLLATAGHAFGKVSFSELKIFLAHLLQPVVLVLPTLLAAVGYVVWKAFRERGAWMVLALALLFQVPVCVLLTVERWALRQFLVPQVLVFCVLAALLVAAATAAWQEQKRSYWISGAVVAASLSGLLLVSSVKSVQALLPEDLTGGLTRQHTVAPQAGQMSDWMADNVPEGERILIVSEPAVNVPQANYLMYLDGGRHEWKTLRLDQGMCLPRPNIQTGCDPDQNSISRIPTDALWVQRIGAGCRVISLSAPNLMEQSRRSGADYVAVPGNHVFPGILDLPPALRATEAFDLAHANVASRQRSGTEQGIVLLRSTGQPPETVPTLMTANTAFSLTRCEQARGPGYEDRINSRFPNGVVAPSATFGRGSP